MPASISLSKENSLLPAEDYVALRKEGFKQIEKLGSALWTDYNNSDPGITILEAVCYAITDLGYRTEFNIKDLVAPEKLTEDTWREVFYTAKKILHNSPLTISDYRKLIIDIKGVRNAWIEKSKDYEVPVWVDYNYPYQTKDNTCSCDDGLDKTCYGKLQLSPIVIADYVAGFQTKLTEANTALSNLSPNATAEERAVIQAQIDKLKWQIDQLPTDPALLIPSKIVEFEGLYNVMIEYEEGILLDQQREEVRVKVVERLSANRNLCEDFLSVNAVEYEDIGAGIFAVLEEYADPDEILAQIFFTIYKYFTPSIPFHTIQQMIGKGYQVDEIFEGPALKHGFIDTVELEKTDLFRDIRLSDIINEVADIKGIKAITYLHLPFTGINDPGADKNFFADWIESLQEQRKIARIIPQKSQAIFCKERDIYTYYIGRPQDRRPDRMLKLFRDLKTRESKYKLTGAQLDFPVPAGEYMNLEDYFPITYSLPRCYGVNDRAGLPPEADEKRKMQALQLKGYLLFFEQLLSGYLAHLNHLRDLFTFDDSVKHNAYPREIYTVATYSETQLSEIEDLKALLIDHENRGADHWDLILKDFTAVLQNLLETPALFYKRRNRMLNHLLARFSEDLSEYERICRWLIPRKVDARLIKDKIAILKNGEYYKISTQRGKGYDYSQSEFWDTQNISGAERRVSRLLGFSNPGRKTLSTEYITVETNADGKNIIKLLDPDNFEKVLLTSVPVKDGCCTELLISQILEHAEDRHYFIFLNGKPRRKGQEGSSAPFWYELYNGTDPLTAVLLAKSEQFQNQEDREKTFDRLAVLLEEINGNEGMHLVENLLLRPKFDEVFDENDTAIDVSFPGICLDGCDLGIGLNEGAVPLYHKKIHRIPAALCFDQMYWVLEYFEYTAADPSVKKYPDSILFQKAFEDGTAPEPLKFRTYELLNKRVKDLQEFGSERINYEIVSNQEEQNNIVNTKYSFIIHGDKGAVLAQSDFIFSKRTNAQIENNEPGDADDIDDEIERLMIYFGFELDLYCAENPCDNNEDPYSFRTTVILPCWPKRLRDHTFRNLVEKTIQKEFPAHVHTRIVWLGILEMKAFEMVYYNWLKEMSLNETPQYASVNPLVIKLNTLTPCGSCDDECDD